MGTSWKGYILLGVRPPMGRSASPTVDLGQALFSLG